MRPLELVTNLLLGVADSVLGDRHGFDLAGGDNGHLLERSVSTVGWDIFDVVNDIHAL